MTHTRQNGLDNRDHPLRRTWRGWRTRLDGNWSRRLAAEVALLYVRVCIRTTRWRISGSPEALALLRGQEPYIYLPWHCNGLLSVGLMRRVGARVPMVFIMSGHRDGQLMARVQSGFGGTPLYGSTGQDGAVRVLRAAVRTLESGKVALGLTPDGPRGPSLQLQPGTAWIASQAKVPAIGIMWMGKRTRILPTWDAYRFPLPFDRGEIAVAGPFEPPEKSAEAREAYSQQVAQAMQVTLAEVNQKLGRPTPQAGLSA